MKKLFALAFGMLLLGAGALAQTTSVTATVTDSDGTIWKNGTWAVDFVANPANSYGIYYFNGSIIPPSMIHQSGSINSSGALSFIVDQNASITPVGSSWNLKVCPDAITQCGIFNFTAIGASMDLSASLTTAIPAPRFHPVSGSYGYNDTEAILSIVPGSTYWNVSSSLQRCYSGSAWTVCNSGNGTNTPSPQFQVPYYLGPGTSAIIKGDSGITTDGSGNLTTVSTIGKSLGEVFYADQYAGSTTDCGISEAANAAAAAGSFLVQLPAGVCNVYTAIVPKPGVTYRGYGGYTGSGNLNNCGTILEVTQSDLFDLSSANSNAEVFEGFCAWSRTGGGGHIFNDTTGQSNVVIRDFDAIQANTNKAVYYSVNASGTVANVLFENGYISVPAATALPMIDIQDPFVGNVTLKDMFIQNSSASTAAYNVLIKSTTNTNSVGPTLIKNVIIEPPSSPYNFAGAFQIQNEGIVVLDSVFIDDLLYTTTAPTISITPDSTLSNGTTSPVTIIGLSSIRGSATNPDLYVAHSTPSQVNIIGSNLGWISGDSGNPFNYVNFNSTIQNSQYATQVLFGNGSTAGATSFAIGGDSAITAGPRAFIQADTGNLTSIVASGQYDPVKAVKAGTIENIVATASSFTCSGNPTITLEDCGTSAGTCASPTALGSATVTAANTSVDGTITSATITAGHYLVWETTAGTCTTLNLSASAEYRMN